MKLPQKMFQHLQKILICSINFVCTKDWNVVYW